MMCALVSSAQGETYSDFAHETLRVGLHSNHIPFSYFSDLYNRHEGLAVDVANELCRRMDANCEFTYADYVKLESALSFNDLDFSVGNYERASATSAKFLYSNYYIRSYPVIISHDYSVVFATADDLRNCNFGVRAGSFEEKIMERERSLSNVAYYTIYGTHTEMFRALERGDIDALYLNNITAYGMLEHEPNALYMASDKYNPKNTYADICVGVSSQNRALLNKINEIIAQLKKDKTLYRISLKYMQNVSNGL